MQENESVSFEDTMRKLEQKPSIFIPTCSLCLAIPIMIAGVIWFRVLFMFLIVGVPLLVSAIVGFYKYAMNDIEIRIARQLNNSGKQTYRETVE